MKKLTTTQCSKCGYHFANRGGNYKRHVNSCDGSYTPPIKNNKSHCKHCATEFDLSDKPKGWMANHSRWCDQNPKVEEYKQKLSSDMSGLRSHITPESRKRANEKIKQRHAEGAYKHVYEARKGKPGTPHTQETKDHLSKVQRGLKHRRLQRNIVYYKGIMMDSTWEVELAKRLDELEIKWIRPEEPLPWIDSRGLTRNYFPDFYLPDYDIYLDPKNPHAIKVQKEKVDYVVEKYGVKIISSLDECKNYSI